MKALVVGFGSIGKRHYDILSGFLDKKNVHIVTRRECDLENSFAGLKYVDDINQYDYFVIASKTIEHYDDLIFINSAVKNKKILVEKPLYETIKSKIELFNQVLVAYNLRFHPLVIELNKRIKNKKIISARFYAGQYLPTWRPGTDYRESYSAKKEEGGGILLDYSHDIDLVNYLLGEITNLEAFNGKVSKLEITSDDYLSMIGKTENNIYFTLSLDSISKIQTRVIQIHLEDESIEVDLISNIFVSKKIDEDKKIFNLKEYQRNTTFENMHKLILESNTSEVATFEDGLTLNKIFDEIRSNSRQKDW